MWSILPLPFPRAPEDQSRPPAWDQLVLGGSAHRCPRAGRDRRDPRSGTIAGEMSLLPDEQLARYRESLEEARDTAIAVLGRTVDDVKPIEASGSAIGRVTRIDAIQRAS